MERPDVPSDEGARASAANWNMAMFHLAKDGRLRRRLEHPRRSNSGWSASSAADWNMVMFQRRSKPRRPRGPPGRRVTGPGERLRRRRVGTPSPDFHMTMQGCSPHPTSCVDSRIGPRTFVRNPVLTVPIALSLSSRPTGTVHCRPRRPCAILRARPVGASARAGRRESSTTRGEPSVETCESIR
jgi:hypothetical protein